MCIRPGELISHPKPLISPLSRSPRTSLVCTTRIFALSFHLKSPPILSNPNLYLAVQMNNTKIPGYRVTFTRVIKSSKSSSAPHKGHTRRRKKNSSRETPYQHQAAQFTLQPALPGISQPPPITPPSSNSVVALVVHCASLTEELNRRSVSWSAA
jgi:hypothetical protein